MAPTAARPAEMAFRELIRLYGLLERVMQPYFARFGISGSQWGILRTLDRAEREGLTALRLTDLSDRLLIRPPSVTGAIDRMERDGLVVRDASATDLRSKNIRLTDQGRRLIEQVLSGHREQIKRVLAALTAAQQSQLQSLLDQLGDHLENLRACRSAHEHAPAVNRN